LCQLQARRGGRAVGDVFQINPLHSWQIEQRRERPWGRFLRCPIGVNDQRPPVAVTTLAV
jgi:hypothetical protein